MINALQTVFGGQPIGVDLLKDAFMRNVQMGRCDMMEFSEGNAAKVVQEHHLANLEVFATVINPEQVLFLAGLGVKLFEYDNEPDGRVTVADYRKGMFEMVDACKSVGVQLHVPALSNLDKNSLDYLYDLRPFPPEVWFSIHRYAPGATFEEAHKGFKTRENEVARWLLHVFEGRPWGVSENGYPSDSTGVTEEEQLRLARRERRFFEQLGAYFYTWYQICDGPHDVPLERFGWYRADRKTPKPVADMYSEAIVVVPPAPDKPAPPGEFMSQYDQFVFDEIRRIGRAWRSMNPGSFPDHVSDGQVEHLFEKIGDMSYRRLVDKKTMRTIFEEIGVDPEQFGEPATPVSVARRGLVRSEGQVIFDDDGMFHPLGCTLFWAPYGFMHERDRIVETLDWLSERKVDYTRNLCEVDWVGRSWGPSDPGYQNYIAETIDEQYNRGIRSQLTLIGSVRGNELGMRVAAIVAEVVNDGRQHKIAYLEVVNEWQRLNKMDKATMIKVGRFLRDNTPNLVALSCPQNSDDEHNNMSYDDMKEASEQAGANCIALHPRRADHDRGWAQVRQAYDGVNFDVATSIQEPAGPQSSVKVMDDKRLLATMRLLGIYCGCAFYTLHVGQGVTGVAGPHGRPDMMMQVPDIEDTFRVIRAIDIFVPEPVENWKVVNNGRGDHPLKLDPRLGVGFWEGSSRGSVNKNYAAISGDQARVVLCGVQAPSTSGPDVQDTNVGTPSRNLHIEAYDILTLELVKEMEVAAGQSLTLPGRKDTKASYLVKGRYV